LGALLVPLDEDYGIPLRRAPDIRQACVEAYGPGEGPSVASLRALLGLIGAHEWRIKGIEIAAIGAESIRTTEYRADSLRIRGSGRHGASASLVLVSGLAFDIGTGTGVLAAVLARRGIRRVVATDRDPAPLTCARENLERLGLAARVEVVQADLFPEGRPSSWFATRPGFCAAEHAHRARDLRPRESHAARVPGRAARAPAARR